ncbi:MAG TPA: DNA polymerase domain-containing protein [Opitutaceae bacterium]|jgi:DNA polymerase elongation subunit (family B)|nr:DNA polymerase domain-containing protein [Opitutaceae bacterium]
MDGTICGVWIDADGVAHVSLETGGGGRVEETKPFEPFAWLSSNPFEAPVAGVELETLAGTAALGVLARAKSLDAFDGFVRTAKESVPVDSLRPLESQFLLQHRARLYGDMSFAKLRRCQVDIETSSADGAFSDAEKPEDRVLAIGMRMGGRNKLLLLEAMTDEAEKKLLLSFNAELAATDPDVIEGHNIFKFDLDYLRQRSRRQKVPCAWGRFGQKATFRSSKLKVAERWIDFPRCDLPGRAVIDTYLLALLNDISSRELNSYGLKEVAIHFGITEEESSERTYIEGSKIAEAFVNDRARFCAYLEDDLRETQGLGDLLLPTYFEQSRAFPIPLQEATLRGTTVKIDLLFLEEYYHARQSCPQPPEIRPFDGGYTRSFNEGVFKHVLHFDVASLYPSLLLNIGRNPGNDTLGVFVPLLRRLLEYRLKYKQIARTSASEEERAEAQARQSSYKILINSFYGYLGFSGARFGDGELAAEVTRRGRELLQSLIDEFARHGCAILEADTDGIYLSSEEYFEKPEELLAKVVPILPPGIELEFDGRYDGMFCYKAKNYALLEEGKVTLRGSALRSRGIEPYLKKLTDSLISYLLGVSPDSPVGIVEEYRKKLGERSLVVAEIAKGEVLSMNPDAYERFIGGGGKPRRASAEAALQMSPRPKMGERVTYFITPKQKGKTSDWQRARPIGAHHPLEMPYDPKHYTDKLDDWLERYGRFLGVEPPKEPENPVQGELL